MLDKIIKRHQENGSAVDVRYANMGTFDESARAAIIERGIEIMSSTSSGGNTFYNCRYKGQIMSYGEKDPMDAAQYLIERANKIDTHS